MPVSIELKSSGILIDTLATKLGIGDLGTKLEKAGYELLMQPKALAITYKGFTAATVQVNPNVLPLYMEDGIGQASLEQVENQLLALYSKAAEYANLAAPNQKCKAPETKSAAPQAGLDPVDSAKLNQYATATVFSNVGSLASASKLHTAVKGSSNGSRYFVVAVGPVNLAARLRMNDGSWSLSVRAEGDLKLYLHTLVSAGFSAKNSYMSLHLENGASAATKQTLLRTLGSIIGGCEVPFSMIAGNNAHLINKGA